MSMTAQELGFKGNRHYEMVACVQCGATRPVSTVDLADPRYTGLCRMCNIGTCNARHWRIDSAGLGTCTVCGGQKRFNAYGPVW